MRLIKRIERLEEKQKHNFINYVSTLSDEDLERICRTPAVESPKQSAAVQEIIQTLSDFELEAISLGKDYLLSSQTLKRLENANNI